MCILNKPQKKVKFDGNIHNDCLHIAGLYFIQDESPKLIVFFVLFRLLGGGAIFFSPYAKDIFSFADIIHLWLGQG